MILVQRAAARYGAFVGLAVTSAPSIRRDVTFDGNVAAGLAIGPVYREALP
jgi:hypothetical protein